ncbi:MAG: pilin [Candidatus Wildermuthbacteria bacterium]|nr:pilin [Candidatus Wildermuthbacteria bacterium]
MTKSLAVLFLVSGLFGFGSGAFAQIDECEPRGPRPDETFSNSWQTESTAYQCGNNECGGQVKQRTTEEEVTTRTFYTPETDPETHCPIWRANTSTTLSGSTRNSINTVPLGKYQSCPESANNAWVSSLPAQCSGKCYPAPERKPLTHGSLQPKNVLDEKGNPKLPVNVGWEDNVEQELAKTENRNPDGSFCEVDKFTYQVGEIASELIVAPDTKNQAVPGGNECALTPNTPYEFSVRACASNSCGKTSEKLNFTTSNTLQLLSPYDPDWEGTQGGIAPVPVTLQWCPHLEANSYKIRAYKVNPETQERGELVLPFGTEKGITKYVDSFLNTFLRGDPAQPETSLYEWEISPCKDSNLKDCGIGSQAWRILPGGELAVPSLRTPANNAAVNMQDSLSWGYVPFASRYGVEISTVGADTSKEGVIAREFVSANPKLSLASMWDKLNFNSAYSWRVAACGGTPESEELSGCGSFSEERVFQTTGAVPTGLGVSPFQDGHTAVPVTFDWDNKDGAASYQLQIGSDQNLNKHSSRESRITIDYPVLLPSALSPSPDIPWSVRTCADEFGLVCAARSELQFFKTAPLKAPTITRPDATNAEFFATTEFAWTKDFGSNFFSYKLDFLSPSAEEKSSSCQTPSPHPIAEGPLERNSASIRFRCLGQYEFFVGACSDKFCQAAGPQTALKLNVQKFTGEAGGLIPCDANNDNPATIGLDEREPCQLKHLFLLVRNLVDFALWKLSLVILIAMTVFTGFTMYTSFGGMEVAAKARSIWKAVGIGFLILLFSWFLLNIFLGLVGFQVNIFGRWHQIPL